MSVSKAIKDLDFLIQNKQQMKSRLIDPKMLWNRGESMMKGLVEDLALVLQRDIDNLRHIKRQLLPEQHQTKIVCKHPKKMHDTSPDGQKYCMNCNADLK